MLHRAASFTINVSIGCSTGGDPRNLRPDRGRGEVAALALGQSWRSPGCTGCSKSALRAGRALAQDAFGDPADVCLQIDGVDDRVPDVLHAGGAIEDSLVTRLGPVEVLDRDVGQLVERRGDCVGPGTNRELQA